MHTNYLAIPYTTLNNIYFDSLITETNLRIYYRTKRTNIKKISFIFSDVPFTIIVPKVDINTIETERLKEFMLEHLVPGVAFSTFNEEDVYGNLNKHKIVFEKLDTVNESQWTLNGFKILRTAVLNDKLSAIFIDGVLGDRRTAFSKRNIQEANRYDFYQHHTESRMGL